MELHSSARHVRAHPDVVSRRLGDRAVLVHLGTNDIFELNDTGARIWELLREDVGLDEIASRLASEFLVDRTRAEHDLHALIERLTSAGLLQS